jgi:regulator of sigma E protease
MHDSVAQKAGLKENDTITKVQGKKTTNWTELISAIQARPDKKTTLTVKSGNKTKDVVVVPKSATSNGQKYGMIGVAAQRDNSVGAKLKYGFTSSFQTTEAIFGQLGKMLTGGFNINQLAGPVGIYSMTSEASSLGIVYVIQFMAMLSLNLGIVNLIPIPALDGGKIIMNIVEAIRRKPIPEEYETIISLIGVGILVLLMVAVTWNDIQRFFIK